MKREPCPGPFLSLLDSRADRVSVEGGDLVFFFPQGIRISCRHPENTKGISTFTEQAELVFRSARLSYCSLFREKRLFGRVISVKRERLTVSELSDRLCRGAVLEFTSEQLSPPLPLLTARLISRRENTDCQIEIECGEVQIGWEGIRTE